VKTEYTPSGVEVQDILRDEDIVQSLWKHEAARLEMILYVITHKCSDKFYIGITNNIKRRVATHKCSSKGRKSALYDWMRKYPEWVLISVCEYETREEAEQDEIFWIDFGRKNEWQLLNLAKGGDGGFVITDVEDWKQQLRDKRKGRKPALGMKHTQKIKDYCGQISREYWASQFTYPKIEVVKLSFKEASKLYGISKTHYYRLKRSLSNEQ